jgi:hypothetical protein
MPEAAPVPEDAPDTLTLLKRITARHPQDVAAGRYEAFGPRSDLAAGALDPVPEVA